MYCSELVYKIYDRALGIKIGQLQRVRDFDLTDAAVQAKMRERYGSEVPLDAVRIGCDGTTNTVSKSRQAWVRPCVRIISDI